MGQASSSSPFPCRTMAASPSVQFTTVRRFNPPDTSVDHEVHYVTEFFVDQFRVSDVLYVFVLVMRQRGGHDQEHPADGQFHG